MAMNSMVIDSQIPIKKQNLQEILIKQYINRVGNGVAYTIGGHQAINKTQKNLIR